jgi:hypothetical protein
VGILDHVGQSRVQGLEFSGFGILGLGVRAQYIAVALDWMLDWLAQLSFEIALCVLSPTDLFFSWKRFRFGTRDSG